MTSSPSAGDRPKGPFMACPSGVSTFPLLLRLLASPQREKGTLDLQGFALLVDFLPDQIGVPVYDHELGVVEHEDHAALAFQGVALVDGRLEDGLVLGIQPHVASHENERVDDLGQGDVVPVAGIGVLGKQAECVFEGLFRCEELPEAVIEAQRLLDGLFFRHRVIGRRLGVDLYILIPLLGDGLCILLDDLDEF